MLVDWNRSQGGYSDGFASSEEPSVSPMSACLMIYDKVI